MKHRLINLLAIDIPYTATDLAFTLGVWPASVRRALKSMMGEGVVERKLSPGAYDYYLNGECRMSTLIHCGYIPILQLGDEP